MASSFHARPRVSARSKVFPLGTGTFPELHWRELDQKKRGGGPGQAASMSSAVTDGPDPVGEGPDVCVSVLILVMAGRESSTFFCPGRPRCGLPL